MTSVADRVASSNRSKARKRGEKVPLMKKGPKPGFRQSPEHVAKRKMWGEHNPQWKGDDASGGSARQRARLRFALSTICEECGAPAIDRHHVDRNPKNNAPSNLKSLCRKCHMEADGTLEAFGQLGRENQPKMVEAAIATKRERRVITLNGRVVASCPAGGEWTAW